MESINRYLDDFRQILAKAPREPISAAVSLLHGAWERQKHVFILGNGGSASTASHLANDLSKATIVPGKRRMRVVSLTDNVALITAWGNDTSYDQIFKQQLENLVQAGDLVIAITASGNSPNVLRAMEFADDSGAVTIAWTGLSGGKVKDMVQLCIHAPTDDVGMIESVHLVLTHLITRELIRSIQAGIPGTDREELIAPIATHNTPELFHVAARLSHGS